MKVRVDEMAWLLKEELGPIRLATLKRNLTVVPKKVGSFPGSDEPSEPIKLYSESKDSIGIPREYFFSNTKNRSDHEILIEVSDGLPGAWPGSVDFRGKLREDQQRALNLVTTELRRNTFGGIVMAKPGWGKCLQLGTEVIKYDGSVVKVEDLVEGDVLLGPDSRPRTILSTARGEGPLFEIRPLRGKPWVCNDVHILTLVHSLTGDIVDIGLQDYLSLPESKKHYLKQFTPPDGVDFEHQTSVPLDPYFAGAWFGDGTKETNKGSGRELLKAAITTPDSDIVSCCYKVAEDFGLRVRKEENGDRCPTYHIVRAIGAAGRDNPVLNCLRSLFGDGTRLPDAYVRGSRETRLEFLAGFLDTDGHYYGSFDFVQKREGWAKDVEFLARSLGLSTSSSEKYVKGEKYIRVKISGNLEIIPTRIPRKMAPKRRQKKVATRTGFSVEPIGKGEWAGFTLEGDGRFLLGDFTVTHNTVFSCGLIAELDSPTLVIVHKEFLMDQWRDRIKEFLPDAKVGYVRQDECSFKGKHVVIAMVQSLVSREYPAEFYSWPSLVLSDEVHRIGARSWSEVPKRFPARWRVGLSATPRRKDGCDKVFWYHIGPVLYESKEVRLSPKIKRVWTNFNIIGRGSFNPKLLNNKALVLRFMCANEGRNKMVIDQVMKAAMTGRKILVLSERVEHLKRLKKLLESEWPPHSPRKITTGLYIGEMKKEEQAASSHAQVIFATSQLVSEGFDLPALDTLFLTTPLSDVEQAVGRICRPFEGKKEPIVVDFRDDKVALCFRTAGYRDKFYRKMEST